VRDEFTKLSLHNEYEGYRQLPESLQPRQALLDAMKEKVLQAGGALSVVGAKKKSSGATASAHGMGGVGKTMMAVQLMQDPEIGTSFEKLLWISVGQEPDIMTCLRVLHFQLKGSHLPASALENERFAVQAMREACRGVKALIVLDDIWDPKVSLHFHGLPCLLPRKYQ
jgi:hypothetical protein